MSQSKGSVKATAQVHAEIVGAAIAAERERCAKIVRERAAIWNARVRTGYNGDCDQHLAYECEDILAAILKG